MPASQYWSYPEVEDIYNKSGNVTLSAAGGRWLKEGVFLWRKNLLETLEAFDSEFKDVVAAAWAMVIDPGIEFMKSRYEG